METFIVSQPNTRIASETKDNQTNGLQKVQIVDVGGEPVGGATEGMQDNIESVLNQILSAVSAVAHAKGVSADLRVTLLGGTTAVTGTLTAVTTVGTVTGVTNIGGIPSVQLIPSNQNIVSVLSNINNITV